MGNPYTSVTVTSYNSNPPADDGSQVPSNRVQWATHKTKIGDPLKTAIESINTNVNTAIAKLVGGAGVTSTAISYTVVAGDHGKLVKITAAGTITTPDATVVGEPFVFGLLNMHSSAITLDGSGSQTINGSASLSVAPGDGYLIFTDGANWFAIGRKTGVLPRGYIDGCTLSNGTDATNDINIAAGVCRDITNAVDMTVAAMTKQLDANWAAGTSAGMRYSGIGIGNGTYHIFAVSKADGTQDIYAVPNTGDPDTPEFAATVVSLLQAEPGGADYLYARRIGSIVRASAAILPFTQRGDVFLLKTPVLDVSVTNPGTSAITATLASCPVGVVVEAVLNVFVNAISGFNMAVYISALDAVDLAASNSAAPLSQVNNQSASSYALGDAGQVNVFTNNSAQIRYRLSSSTTSDTFMIATCGWNDPRGKK